ncbi:hypothetical protein PFISCL1PPCAC_18501, partial [Pristionchus fissidentatus]
VVHLQPAQQLQLKSSGIRSVGRTWPVIKCKEPACDFTYKQKGELHYQIAHGKVFKLWIRRGEHNIIGGAACPYCPYPVGDVIALNQHLLMEHDDRVMKQGNLFACSSCRLSYNRLYLLYYHWHHSPLCVGPVLLPSMEWPIKDQRSVDPQPPPSLPRELMEMNKELITGPKGEKGFKQMLEQCGEEMSK